MPFPLIPVAVGAGLGIAAAFKRWRNRQKLIPPKGMTPERKRIYEAALNTLKDPAKLRILAEAFRKEGLIAESELLEKRAALRELSPEQRKINNQKFKDGMALKDPEAVLKVAGEFEQTGATGAAFNLRKYAKGLQASK